MNIIHLVHMIYVYLYYCIQYCNAHYVDTHETNWTIWILLTYVNLVTGSESYHLTCSKYGEFNI